MNSLLKAIFNRFAESVIAKYEIDTTTDEMYAMWKQTIRSLSISVVKSGDETSSEDEAVKVEKAKPVKPKKEEKPRDKTEDKPTEASINCPYKAKKGANAGVPCGKGVAKDSIMCSSHKKYAGEYEKVVDSDEEKPDVKPPAKKVTADSKPKTDAPLGCSYVFTRGNNLGKRCGTGQVSGTEFCSKHQDKAAKKIEKKDAVPKPKATADSKPKNVFVADASGRLVMKGDLPLVCKSAQEKLIIGKIEDDEIVPLTEEDIKVCDERNLKYEVSSKKKIDKALEDVLDEVMGEEEELVEDPEDPDYEPEEGDNEEELLEEDE
jgi:hypothetical protein